MLARCNKRLWSGFLPYATGVEARVEIESE